MKQLLFLLLFPCLALAQYQGNGNQKITLGEQTTADGLVYRGVLADTGNITPFSDTSAYIILDTVNNRFFHYKRNTNVWSVAGGSDTSLIAYVNTYGAQTVNGAKTLTSNLIIKNSQEPSRATVVTTQTFAADTTNWTRGAGWTFDGTQAVATAATGNLTYTPALTITSGNAYEITYTVTGYSAGTLTVALGNVSLALPTHNATANVILLSPTSATGGFRFTTSTFTGNVDNVSIVEISNVAPVIFAGQDDGAATLYNSLRMPNSTTLAFGGGASYTTGVHNIANGQGALQNNTTGNFNIANGRFSLLSNTTGNNNIASGQGALQNNTIGINNVANGVFSLQSNITGNSNIANGESALQFNTTGNSNIANGTNALALNRTGSGNIANGTSALRSNRTGNNNIAFGISALYNITVGDTLTGSNNLAFGTNAADNIKFAASGNVAIGNSVDLPDPSGSNQVVIKNIIYATGASGTGTISAGNVGIGTNAPTARLQVKGSGVTTGEAFKIENSGGTNLLTVLDNGSMTLNTPLSVTNGGTGTVSFSPNNYLIRTNSSGAFDTAAIYEANGNVGIGTNTPTYKLDILDNALRIGETFENTGRRDINTLKTGEFITPSYANGKDIIVFRAINNITDNSLNFGGGTSNFDSPTFIAFWTASTTGSVGSEKMRITSTGNVGIGQTTPTAVLHLKAGTATAGTAPLKFTSGVNLTSPLGGEMEFNGTNLFFSPSTTRHTVNHGLTGSATLNFPSTTTLLSADLTITVTGAADGDVVSLGVPNAAVNANTSYSAWVSAANTVTVRFNNYSSGTVDPASGLFKVFVTK